MLTSIKDLTRNDLKVLCIIRKGSCKESAKNLLWKSKGNMLSLLEMCSSRNFRRIRYGTWWEITVYFCLEFHLGYLVIFQYIFFFRFFKEFFNSHFNYLIQKSFLGEARIYPLRYLKIFFCLSKFVQKFFLISPKNFYTFFFQKFHKEFVSRHF